MRRWNADKWLRYEKKNFFHQKMKGHATLLWYATRKHSNSVPVVEGNTEFLIYE